MNLYGFADGDPVNYSDPFGLTPCLTPPIAMYCLAAVAAAGAATAATLMTVAHGDDMAAALGAGADAAREMFGNVLAFGKNRGIKAKLEGEAGVIEQHFVKLTAPGQPGGDDPNNRNKWKKDIRRHIDEMKKQIKKLKGDRNKQPWLDKIREYEEQLRHLQ